MYVVYTTHPFANKLPHCAMQITITKLKKEEGGLRPKRSHFIQAQNESYAKLGIEAMKKDQVSMQYT